MIRHARLRPETPVLPLPVTMIVPCFRTVPIPAIGNAMLTQPGLLTAGKAAIALSAIAVGTDKKHRMALAAQTNPLPENHFALLRHARSQAGLDNGRGFVAL
jgi:hypothetical protein